MCVCVCGVCVVCVYICVCVRVCVCVCVCVCVWCVRVCVFNVWVQFNKENQVGMCMHKHICSYKHTTEPCTHSTKVIHNNANKTT